MKPKTRSIEQIIEEQVRRWQIVRTEEKKADEPQEPGCQGQPLPGKQNRTAKVGCAKPNQASKHSCHTNDYEEEEVKIKGFAKAKTAEEVKAVMAGHSYGAKKKK